MEKNKNLYNRPNDSLSRNPQQRRRRRASIRNHSAGYHDYKSQRVIQTQICQKVMDNKMKKKKRIWKEIIPITKLSCETRRFACPPRYCKKILKRKEIIKGEMKNFWEYDYTRENEREMEEIKREIKFWF